MAAGPTPYTLGVFPYVPPLTIDRIFGPVAVEFAKELDRPVHLRTKSTFENFAQEMQNERLRHHLCSSIFLFGCYGKEPLSSAGAAGWKSDCGAHGAARKPGAQPAGSRRPDGRPAAAARGGERAGARLADRCRPQAGNRRHTPPLPHQDVVSASRGDRGRRHLRGAEVHFVAGRQPRAGSTSK